MKWKVAKSPAFIGGCWLCALSMLVPKTTPTAISASAPFTFIAWGDSRASTAGRVNTMVLSALSNQARGITPGPVITLFAGDLCDSFTTVCTSTGTDGWKYALNGGSANNGMSDITFPFRGNHDGNSALWDSYFAGRNAAVVAVGGTNFSFYPVDGPERTYSFDYANSHFIGIDMPGGDISTMTPGQIDWLDSDITAAEARRVTHTFILDHGPIFHVDGHRSTPPVSLIDVMNKHASISATFHGHEHVMAYIHVDSSHIPGVTHPWEEFVAGAAGAPRYACDSTRLKGATDYCNDQANGFMSVEVNDNTFTVSLYLEGEPVAAKTWTFTKSPLPPVSSIDLDLGAGGAVEARTAGSKEPTRAGYARVAISSGGVPYGTAVFSFKQNGVTASEAGVPASPPTTKARLFIDYRSDVPATIGRIDAGTIDINTGIAIVNAGSATANVTYNLRDIMGASISIGHGTLPAGGHFAKFIDQLKEVAPDFDLPPAFQTNTGFGSLEIASDQPLSILPLRQTTNQRNEALFTTTPIADLSQPLGSNPIYFPQFVDGGGYSTALALLNTSDKVESGIIEIFDDNGSHLVANQVGGKADSTFWYSIPAGGVFRFQTDGFPATVNVGWVHLIPDSGSSTPVGAGIFSLNSGNVLVADSGVSASTATTHAHLYIDLSGGHNTGVAIANPANTTASVTVKAFRSDGVTGIGTSQGPLKLAANGHNAKFANEFIAGLPAGFTGVLDIASVTPFAALTLRSLNNERNDFLMTAFPVADANKIAPSPVVFPQIADGNGFVSQVILISASQASRTTLSFLGDDGKPLAIGK